MSCFNFVDVPSTSWMKHPRDLNSQFSQKSCHERYMFFPKPHHFGVIKKMNPFVTNRFLGDVLLNQPFSGHQKKDAPRSTEKISGFRHRVMMPTAVPRARASHVLVGLELSVRSSAVVEGMAEEESWKGGKAAFQKRGANLGRFPITVQHGKSKILCTVYCIITYVDICTVYIYLDRYPYKSPNMS